MFFSVLSYGISHKSVWLFSLCQEHQRPVNDTRDMSGIPHSCLGCDSQSAGLQTVKLKLSKAKFWQKNVDSQIARLHDLIFGNLEIRQLELWNFEQWEILLLVPGKVLWRRSIGCLGAKINRALMWNHYRSPSPWGDSSWTRALQSTPFQNPEGGAQALRKDKRTAVLVSNIG